MIFRRPSGLFSFLALSLVLVAGQFSAVLAQDSGRITVVVTNRSAGKALAGHEVNVLRHTDEGGQTQQVATGKTDRQGRYVFRDLPLDGAHYVVATLYQNVQYTTDHLVLEPEQATFDTSMDVYDSGSSDELIGVGALHLIIEVNPDVLNITEIVILRNNGGSTFVAEGHDSAIALTLPNAAFGLQPVTPGIENTDHGLRFTNPVPPGETQVFYTYSVDRGAIDDVLARRMEYDTARAQVFILPSTLAVTAINLTTDGVRQIGDKSYMTLSNTVGPTKGMTISIEIPSELIWQDVMKWGVLGLVVLMALGAVMALARWEPAVNGKAGEPEPERAEHTPEEAAIARAEYEDLVIAIVDLDESYESGEIEENAYKNRRRKLKKRARGRV